MKPFLHFIPLALLIGLTGSTCISCSTTKAPVIEKRAEMPTNYPKTSGPVLQKLSNFIPDDAEILAFTSYGTITELIAQFDKYQIVDSNDLKNTLKDLGKHYLLNTGKLKDYYDAGMNTASGLVAGYRDNNLFFVFDTLNNDLFKKWLDNLINEEYGRPTYHESSDGNHTFFEITVLHKDLCTMVITPNEPVLLVMGPKILPEGTPSLETAKSIIHQNKLGSNAETIIRSTQESPMSIWVDSKTHLMEQLPDNIQKSITEWISAVTLNVNFSDHGPEFHLTGTYTNDNYQNIPRGIYISSLLSGTNATHAQAILSSNPVSAFRLFINNKELESVLLPELPAKARNSYNDIKGKLTKKILNLDVSEQIIYNMGAIWFTMYQTSTDNPEVKDTARENDNSLTLQSILNHSIAIYIPLKNTKNSDTFFSKVNAIKSFIPENMANIEKENDILHARIKYQQNIIHAGYYRGMIAITTDSAWPQASQVLTVSDAPDNRSLLTNETLFLATHLDLKYLSELPFIQASEYSSIINQIADKFKSVDIQSNSDNTMMNIQISADVAF